MDELDQHYRTLGLEPGASLEEVKQAYRDLAKVWHPDRFSHDHRLQQKTQEKLKEINFAYDFLLSFYSRSNREASQPKHQRPASGQASTSTQNRQPPPEPSPRANTWLKLTGNWRAWIFILIIVGTLFSLILLRQFGRSARSSPTADGPNSQNNNTAVPEHALPPAESELETDLNGFRLLQSKHAVETVLGPPSKKLDSDSQAYRIDNDAYLVFGYSKKDPYHIASIQLTGHTNMAKPFRGLVLGDDVDKVNRVLGKPARVKSVASPQVSLFEYQHSNYSVEIDNSGRLYSIRIFTNEKLLTVEGDSDADWREFKAAIIAKDFIRIIAMLRPDVEILKNGKVLSVNQKHSDFTENPDKEIIDALVGNTDSALQEVIQTEPERELRLVEGFGMGEVYKFYEGRILAEIVFFPYNGRYRVYEIAFRDAQAR